LPYQVQILPAALKQLAKIPNPDRRRITERIERLADDPRPSGSKKLAGKEELHRIRIGDYRVIDAINDGALLVIVVRIGQRGDVYRSLESHSKK
jgi:mRNA interferase RelE/StbE